MALQSKAQLAMVVEGRVCTTAVMPGAAQVAHEREAATLFDGIRFKTHVQDQAAPERTFRQGALRRSRRMGRFKFLERPERIVTAERRCCRSGRCIGRR